jgi:hypothetical protein
MAQSLEEHHSGSTNSLLTVLGEQLYCVLYSLSSRVELHGKGTEGHSYCGSTTQPLCRAGISLLAPSPRQPRRTYRSMRTQETADGTAFSKTGAIRPSFSFGDPPALGCYSLGSAAPIPLCGALCVGFESYERRATSDDQLAMGRRPRGSSLRNGTAITPSPEARESHVGPANDGEGPIAPALLLSVALEGGHFPVSRRSRPLSRSFAFRSVALPPFRSPLCRSPAL